jgi:hypothetical protein
MDHPGLDRQNGFFLDLSLSTFEKLMILHLAQLVFNQPMDLQKKWLEPNNRNRSEIFSRISSSSNEPFHPFAV